VPRRVEPPRRPERAERDPKAFRALDEDQYDIPAFLRRGGQGAPE
jgi:hypothetical protein